MPVEKFVEVEALQESGGAQLAHHGGIPFGEFSGPVVEQGGDQFSRFRVDDANLDSEFFRLLENAADLFQGAGV
jgi:hypothetical protein